MPDPHAAAAPFRPRSGVRGLLLSVVVFSVFVNLLMLTGPFFMLQVYDRVLVSRSEETLAALFGLVCVLYTFYWLLEYSRGRILARVGARIQSSLAGPAFRAVLERAALQKGPRSGSLLDLEAVRTFIASPVALALLDLPWTPVFVVAIFMFHPLLGWLAVAGAGLLFATALLNQALTSRQMADASRLSLAAMQTAREAEAAAELVRAQGIADPMRDRWIGLQEEAMERSMLAGDRTGTFGSFSKSLRLFLQSALLAAGAWLVLHDQLTAGAIIAASILLGRALAPVELVISQWAVLQRARAGWTDLGRLIAELPPGDPATELPAPTAWLDVNAVTVVARPGSAPLLRQVSLGLRPGEAVGVIGRSGSGKSTLARVIVGLIPPTAGEVRLSGATLDQYGPRRLGACIGYLPQDVQLFEGTVAENIARMDLAPDAEKVVAAARKAHVHDVILKLPGGYDARIGPADTRLSGGQRQRLALARALYGDPVLLVLDEPNSALDAEGSDALNAVVSAMKADGRGVLIMTHRPMAISACDRLLVLEGGAVAASGPRDEIVRAMIRNANDVERVLSRGAGG